MKHPSHGSQVPGVSNSTIGETKMTHDIRHNLPKQIKNITIPSKIEKLDMYKEKLLYAKEKFQAEA